VRACVRAYGMTIVTQNYIIVLSNNVIVFNQECANQPLSWWLRTRNAQLYYMNMKVMICFFDDRWEQLFYEGLYVRNCTPDISSSFWLKWNVYLW